MTSRNQTTILLYSPLAGRGHLDGWLAMFADRLAEQGRPVVCLTPGPEALAANLRRRGRELSENLAIAPWPAPQETDSPWSRFKGKALDLGHEISKTYVHRLENSRVAPDMPWPRRYRKRLLQLLAPPAYAVFDAARRRLPKLIRSARAELRADQLSPEVCAWRLRRALKNLPPGRYFLFNMYLDVYPTTLGPWATFARLCPLPWAGLRFVPGPAPGETYCALPSLRGLCFLDDAARSAHAAAWPSKHFATLPDVADPALSASPSPLAAEIRRRAAGRKIVFLGGSIGVQKNIGLWRELTRRANPARFFFALVGQIHYGTFPENERRLMRELAKDPPENIFLHAGYLPDERDFNACLAASDLIFAVYKNFRLSSNMPGKAAAFEKPVLVSDLWLMGDRVRRHGLGAAVPEDDPAAALAALESLLANPPPPAAFAAYRAAHSEAALSRALADFLAVCRPE